MFKLLGSGVVTTNGLSLMLRCLIQLLRHTVLHQWLHCIGDLKRRNVGNMSRGLGRLRWVHLSHWSFQRLVESVDVPASFTNV